MFAADCTSCSYAEICISRQCARVCRAYVIKLSPASEGHGWRLELECTSYRRSDDCTVPGALMKNNDGYRKQSSEQNIFGHRSSVQSGHRWYLFGDAGRSRPITRVRLNFRIDEVHRVHEIHDLNIENRVEIKVENPVS